MQPQTCTIKKAKLNFVDFTSNDDSKEEESTFGETKSPLQFSTVQDIQFEKGQQLQLRNNLKKLNFSSFDQALEFNKPLKIKREHVVMTPKKNPKRTTTTIDVH